LVRGPGREFPPAHEAVLVAAHRVRELQGPGEELEGAPEVVVRGPVGDLREERVAEDRQADAVHVYAQLVRAAGVRGEAVQRQVPLALGEYDAALGVRLTARNLERGEPSGHLLDPAAQGH